MVQVFLTQLGRKLNGVSRLDEQQRRWYLAMESERLGHGADCILFEIIGVDEKTIRRGRVELASSLIDRTG